MIFVIYGEESFLMEQKLQALKKEYQDFYFELLPDIEFEGNSEVSQ